MDGNPLAEPTTAQVAASFEDGTPAVAVNCLGRGEVVLFNWHAERCGVAAVDEAMRRALRRMGVQAGSDVRVLRSKINMARYGQFPYAGVAQWVQELGYKPAAIGDEDLARLPSGAAVVLPKHYMMTDGQAAALVRHVEAGGNAVFIDGPVYVLDKSPAARKLLGFARMGKYFSGPRLLTEAEANRKLALLPAGGPELSIAAERPRHERWDAWRKDQVTRLVSDVYRAVRAKGKECRVTAAVFDTADGAHRVGQDWPRWLREGLVDYVVPMSYVTTAEALGKRLAWYKTLDVELKRIFPAVGSFKIGVGEPSARRAALIAEQIDLCRRQGARGVVLFNLHDLDDETAAAVGRAGFGVRK